MLIYQMMQMENEDTYPYLVSMIPLTKLINQKGIFAEYENGTVNIVLPFDGYDSDIEHNIRIIRK